jgi:hypothetical protein
MVMTRVELAMARVRQGFRLRTGANVREELNQRQPGEYPARISAEPGAVRGHNPRLYPNATLFVLASPDTISTNIVR